MRRYNRKTRSNRFLVRLRGFREWTEVVGQIFRDLTPVIVALLVGVGWIFDGDENLRQLVALLTK